LSAILFLYWDVLGHSDVSTTMIYTHVLNKGGKGVSSPLDHLRCCLRPSLQNKSHQARKRLGGFNFLKAQT
jgi:hypothetical protein